MFVGIDVHKHQHVAALLDGVGRTLASLTFANTAGEWGRLSNGAKVANNGASKHP